MSCYGNCFPPVEQPKIEGASWTLWSDRIYAALFLARSLLDWQMREMYPQSPSGTIAEHDLIPILAYVGPGSTCSLRFPGEVSKDKGEGDPVYTHHYMTHM
jgi:hypothetical protein